MKLLKLIKPQIKKKAACLFNTCTCTITYKYGPECAVPFIMLSLVSIGTDCVLREPCYKRPMGNDHFPIIPL